MQHNRLHRFWITLAAVGLWVLTGCSKPPQWSSHSASSKAIELTLTTWGSREELTLLQSQLEGFHRRYPDIRVAVKPIPESYLAKLQLLAISDALPDVLLINSWYLPRLAYYHLIQPLPSQPRSLWADFYPVARQALSYQQQPFALPRDLSALGVVVNLDLLNRYGLSAPPPHWQLNQMEAMGQQLMARTQPITPRIYPISFYREPPLYWLPWIWIQGGRLMASAQQPLGQPATCLALHESRSVEALARYMQWTATGMAPAKRAIAQTTMTQLFLQQRLAFLVTGRWSVPLLRQQATFRWGIWPIPQGPYGSITGIDASGYALSRTTRYPRQALLLMKYLTSAPVLSAQAQAGLMIPARKTVAHNQLQHEPTFLAMIATGQPTQSSPHWPAIETTLSRTLAPFWDPPPHQAPQTHALQHALKQVYATTCAEGS
ncbi:MAG: extracellular solute-binding protein [Vampirovibrionales bacterium]